MTSVERAAAAFDHREPDKVPVCHVSCSSKVASQLLGRDAYVGFGIQQWREAKALWEGADAHAEFVERTYRDMLDINLLFDNDLMRFAYGRYNVKPTKRIDENTFLYEYGDESEWHILRHDPQQELINSLFRLHPQPPLQLDDLKESVLAMEKKLENYNPRPEDYTADNLTIRAQQELSDRWVIRMGGGSVNISRDEAWLLASVMRPDLVGRYLDVRTESTIRQARALAPLGFRYLFGGGDFAGNTGPLYSPRVFHELVLPRLQRVSEEFHRIGVKWLFASDGDLWPVADDLFGASGVDGYYEIDRDCDMDIPRLRERFPHLTLVGNLSSHLVHRGTKEQVIEQTLACVEEAKRCRGVIVGISNMIMSDSPIENVEAMIETIRDNR